MFSVGSSELIVILVIALVVVGPKRLPEILRGAVKIYKTFMDAVNEAKKEIEEDIDSIDVKKDIEEKWKDILDEDEKEKEKKP